jgi:serine/threonine protein kinase
MEAFARDDAGWIARRYEIITPIASGGMATVWRGWDHFIGRYVAIKALHAHAVDEPDLDPHSAERFQREAQAAAKIAHPNVVIIYDFIVERGQQFMIMEFVDGVNLKRFIADHGPLPIARALAITEQICAALAAHARGLIHRDIKPQNILLTADGRARLTDFGIVRLADGDALTHSGIVLGTADYLSPEQARGDHLGPQSDIYSLGVVLFEMLTGTPPFTGANPVSIAMRHATEAIPALASRNPHLPAELEALLRKAVEREPKRRYRTATLMGRAIQLYRQRHLRPTPFAPPHAAAERPQIARPVAPARTRRAPLRWLTRLLFSRPSLR